MSINKAVESFEKYKSDVEVREESTLQLVRNSLGGADTWQMWNRGRPLGHGSFGEVWQERWEDKHGDWHYRAVKICSERNMRAARIDYKRELSALAAFSRSDWMHSGNIFVAMEYLGHGDLSKYADTKFLEMEIKEIADNVLRGLKFMHGEGFTHRDIKPQRWWVKIADFGISKRVIEASDSALHTTVGTRQYCAPEILDHLKQYQETSSYSSKVDIWSLGCVLFNLSSQGHIAFSDSDLVRYCDGTLSFNPQEVRLSLGDSGESFAKALLTIDPEQRPTATEALQHRWLTMVGSTEPKNNSILEPKSQSRGRQNYNSFLDSTLSMGPPQDVDAMQLTMRPINTMLNQSMPKPNDAAQKSLSQPDYVNVLVVGETGVGKSIFINAFVNYLLFETLDEAIDAAELHYVIPCSFLTQTMERVNVGFRDDEEDGSKDSSAIQRTHVYPINVGTTMYRLIDVPDIGDTRGIKYDKTNMAHVLPTLSCYDELHGVLILFNSNNWWMTTQFTHYLKDLLTHLYRSTAVNMVFGFTNTRITNTRISNYTTGNTLRLLRKQLAEHPDLGLSLTKHTVYHFSSESFRYLAAYKQEIHTKNREDFRRSWQRSRDEAWRMLDHFKARPLHPDENTIILNDTRELICGLAKPMVDISKVILTNMAVYADDILRLRDRGTAEQRTRHASDFAVKQTAITMRERLIKEYEAEHDKIQNIAAKFSVWLREKSITPYNDATLAYLDVLIKQEEAKVRAGYNDKMLVSLQADYEKHKELVAVLKLSINSNDGYKSLDPKGVAQLASELYRLKHFGKMLENCQAHPRRGT